MDTPRNHALSHRAPLVAVLGAVRVVGSERPLRRASSVDLVCYLAFHRGGATTDQWVTALWPDRLMSPATIYSTASAARRCLGADAKGEDFLPQRHHRLALSSEVRTDLDLVFDALDSGDPEVWLAAVDLVQGRPFEGLRGGDWSILEGHVATAEEAVVALAERLVPHLLAHGDPARGARVIRTMLAATPYDERLWRLLFDATYCQGRRIALDQVAAEMAVTLGARGFRDTEHCVESVAELVHPATWEHYKRLRHGPLREAG